MYKYKGKGRSNRKWKKDHNALNKKNDPGGLKQSWNNKRMNRAIKFVKNAEEELGIPNWDEMNLEPIQKNFYQEHPLVHLRNEATVQLYRDQNRISVQGWYCPKPIQTFEELNFPPPIMAALREQNFVTPTPIQSQALPIALSGRDMIGIADTGSGKTLAYILPAIVHIYGKQGPRNVGEPDVVVLAPTRELAIQINEVVESLRPYTQVNSECFYGGANRKDMMFCAERVFEICVATPGRMIDFLVEGLINLHRCTYFVLDEADRMLDMGFEPQIKTVINQARPDRQTLMFSATWPRVIQELADKYLSVYIKVNIGSLQVSANHNITQKIVICEESEKQEAIVKLMKDVMQERQNKTLIFCNSKVDVDYLTLKFRLNGWEACSLHGNMKQKQRERVFGDFKTGVIGILIATDVAARGLDVDDIKFIINYDYPQDSEDYVHRIGRTGRCNRTGTAITLLTRNNCDKVKKLISVLEEANQEIDPELYRLAALPAEKTKLTPRELRLRAKMMKKEMKEIVKRRSVINKVPLGVATNSESLPDLHGVTLPRNFHKLSNFKKRAYSDMQKVTKGEVCKDAPVVENPPKIAKIQNTQPADHEPSPPSDVKLKRDDVNSETSVPANSQTFWSTSATGLNVVQVKQENMIQSSAQSMPQVKESSSIKEISGNNFSPNNQQEQQKFSSASISTYRKNDTGFPMGGTKNVDVTTDNRVTTNPGNTGMAMGPRNMHGSQNMGPGNRQGFQNMGSRNMRGFQNMGPGNNQGFQNMDPGHMQGFQSIGPGNMQGFQNVGPGNMQGFRNVDRKNLQGFRNMGPGNMQGFQDMRMPMGFRNNSPMPAARRYSGPPPDQRYSDNWGGFRSRTSWPGRGGWV